MRCRWICGALAGLLLWLPIQVHGASSDEIRQQIDELEEEYEKNGERMDELEELISQNVQEIADIVAQKYAVDQQISLLYDQIAITNEQIRHYADLVALEQEALDQAQEKWDKLNGDYIDRIRAMEKSGNISYWSILLSSDSFADFLDRINMIREIAEADQRRLQELRAAAREVEEHKDALAAEKTNHEQAREELLLTQQVLEEKRVQADELLRRLVAKGEEYERLLDEAEERESDLLKQIAKKENEFDKAKYQEWLASQKPVTGGNAGGGTQTGGTVNTSGWMTPVPYYTLTSPFGMRPHPILGYPRMHNGVDLACAANTPIYASKDGVVNMATYSDSAGNFVRLDHDGGYSSVYMHMTRYTVKPGQYVARGQIIGYVGNTGLSKGNHLHFGISLNGKYVNPMEYIG